MQDTLPALPDQPIQHFQYNTTQQHHPWIHEARDESARGKSPLPRFHLIVDALDNVSAKMDHYLAGLGEPAEDRGFNSLARDRRGVGGDPCCFP